MRTFVISARRLINETFRLGNIGAPRPRGSPLDAALTHFLTPRWEGKKKKTPRENKREQAEEKNRTRRFGGAGRGGVRVTEAAAKYITAAVLRAGACSQSCCPSCDWKEGSRPCHYPSVGCGVALHAAGSFTLMLDVCFLLENVHL